LQDFSLDVKVSATLPDFSLDVKVSDNVCLAGCLVVCLTVWLSARGTFFDDFSKKLFQITKVF
jgi:hypothetical protein